MERVGVQAYPVSSKTLTIMEKKEKSSGRYGSIE